MVRIVALALAAASVAQAAFFGGVKNHVNINDLILESDHSEAIAAAGDQWFQGQLVDHTDPANTKTWKQRYHVNTQWFGRGNSPVFIYINGENVASAGTVTSTSYFMNELAQKYKALVVSLEHRFYGSSQPTGDLSTASLKYLSADQALADLAKFQDFFIAQNNLTTANKWVTFGGSYPGMLSGWAKSKYPTRFAGSVASSAPIWTKTDYYEYSEVVAFGLKYYGGDACVKVVGDGLTAFHALVASASAADTATLKKLFNPCSPLKNDFDRATLELQVFGNFQGISQYNGLQGDTLANVCKTFVANSGSTPLQKLSTFTQKYWDSRRCTGSDYDTENIKPFLSTTVSSSIMRQWWYQTCAEFGFGQTTAKSNSIFSALKYANVDVVYYEMCKRVYGITNTEDRVAATRAKYGALKINVPNVVWPSGNIDPWSALAFTNSTKPVNPNSDVVYTAGTSHCADMYSRSSNKVPRWALDRIERNVKTFLTKA